MIVPGSCFIPFWTASVSVVDCWNGYWYDPVTENSGWYTGSIPNMSILLPGNGDTHWVDDPINYEDVGGYWYSDQTDLSVLTGVVPCKFTSSGKCAIDGPGNNTVRIGFYNPSAGNVTLTMVLGEVDTYTSTEYYPEGPVLGYVATDFRAETDAAAEIIISKAGVKLLDLSFYCAENL